MLMKSLYAFLMVLFLAVVPAFAQDEPPSDSHQPPSADEIVSKMQSKLNLTADQVTAITPIIEKYRSKREELHQSMEDGTADRDSLRSQMKELKEDETQELSQVLSADQMSQLAKMHGRRHQEGENGGSDGSSNHDGDSHPDGDNPPPNQ